MRWRIGRERTRVLNRVRQLNLEQHCPTKGIQTVKARRWLQELPLGALNRWELDGLLRRWEAITEEWQALEEKVRQRQAQQAGSAAPGQ